MKVAHLFVSSFPLAWVLCLPASAPVHNVMSRDVCQHLLLFMM